MTAGEPEQTCAYRRNKMRHEKVLRILITKEMLIKIMGDSKCLAQPKDGEVN